ncbi:MAG: Gfo/Idh/MocA family oxidoreductase [Planctomycetes bacterium]|nr:Gfo/Idh/MocA family oxidoreductase [Planctomycetota bacterium]
MMNITESTESVNDKCDVAITTLAVIGVGHLGKHHARICRSLAGTRLAAVVDTNPKTAREKGLELNVPYYTDYKKLFGAISATVIATPTITHYKIAKDFITRGIHVFIEKPITTTINQAKSLIKLAKQYRVKLQVGHIERFNPALKAVREDITSPRFIESHRLSPLSFRSLDIDVVRDLMIHDIDIVCSLNNQKPVKIFATGVPVFSRKVDIANARLVFPNGCVANLTASRVSDKSMRKMRIFSKDAYASIDFASKNAQVYRKSPQAPSPKKILQNIDLNAIKDYQSLMLQKFLEIKNPVIEKTDQIESELGAFIGSIQEGRPVVVTGEDGLRALETAELIIKQINKE